MIHNDVLRRLRYALKLNDQQMLAVFKLVDYEIDVTHLHHIMLKEEEEGFILCRDSVISLFLDGLIIHYRGKVEGREPQPPKKQISKNDILRKIRIALELQAEDMIEILGLVDFRLSKPELSAFFRKTGHRNYKECGDQVLRNFLAGLVKRHRGDEIKENENKETVQKVDK
ncbi:MAG: hypothetical protein ACI8WB_002805 [Phenylobacterium sp.]|jgi:uncharacterized protein YehS (DUF1456 family)